MAKYSVKGTSSFTRLYKYVRLKIIKPSNLLAKLQGGLREMNRFHSVFDFV